MASPQFTLHFDKGLNAYLDKKWGLAKDELTQANSIYMSFRRANGNYYSNSVLFLNMYSHDIFYCLGIPVEGHPPTLVILSRMEESQFVCPADWKGYYEVNL